MFAIELIPASYAFWNKSQARFYASRNLPSRRTPIMPVGMSLSRKIREERKRKELTQGELAVRVGVSQSAVSKWESGAQVPDTASLIALSSALGVPATWLWTGQDEQHPFERYPSWKNIKIVGAIEMFVSVDALTWDEDDQFEINAPPNLTDVTQEVVGYVIRDDEAAPYFGKDSIVFVAKVDFRTLILRSGDYVVAAEQDMQRDLYEITIRELWEVSEGNFKMREPALPEERPTKEHILSLQPDGTARGVRKGGDQLIVIGLVVASFRLEGALSRMP